MKQQALALIIFSAISFGATSAYAVGQDTTVNGGIVHFTGEIVNAACSVSTNSDGQTVKLGQYRTTAFATAGATSASIPFNIVLNDCDPSVSSLASMSFSGQALSTDPTLLAVNASGDNAVVATGVGIEIMDKASTVLPPDGTTYSAEQTLINGTNTFPFSARYKSTAASVTAGKANADATFAIHYE
jgi:major type 1 subunit fimbrin (pilin)